MEILDIQKLLEPLKSLDRLTINFQCSICGKSLEVSNTKNGFQEKLKKHPDLSFFRCKSCSIKEGKKLLSEEEKKASNEKRKKTSLEKYGVENVSKSETVKSKIKTTFQNKYGVDNISQLDEVKLKKKRTLQSNYGVDSVLEIPGVREKVSSENALLSMKTKLTEIWKDQNRRQEASEKAKLRVDQAFKERRSNASKTFWSNITEDQKLEIRRKSNKKGKYKSQDGEVFDSLWELRYYEYCKSKGYNIIREPVGLEYFYLGKPHTYYPDFEVNGKLVEVKGNHLKDSEGKWFCPFKAPNHSKDYLNGLYEAKRQCAISNNVTILYQEDLINLGIRF